MIRTSCLKYSLEELLPSLRVGIIIVKNVVNQVQQEPHARGLDCDWQRRVVYVAGEYLVGHVFDGGGLDTATKGRSNG